MDNAELGRAADYVVLRHLIQCKYEATVKSIMTESPFLLEDSSRKCVSDLVAEMPSWPRSSLVDILTKWRFVGQHFSVEKNGLANFVTKFLALGRRFSHELQFFLEAFGIDLAQQDEIDTGQSSMQRSLYSKKMSSSQNCRPVITREFGMPNVSEKCVIGGVASQHGPILLTAKNCKLQPTSNICIGDAAVERVQPDVFSSHSVNMHASPEQVSPRKKRKGLSRHRYPAPVDSSAQITTSVTAVEEDSTSKSFFDDLRNRLQNPADFLINTDFPELLADCISGACNLDMPIFETEENPFVDRNVEKVANSVMNNKNMQSLLLQAAGIAVFDDDMNQADECCSQAAVSSNRGCGAAEATFVVPQNSALDDPGNVKSSETGSVSSRTRSRVARQPAPKLSRSTDNENGQIRQITKRKHSNSAEKSNVNDVQVELPCCSRESLASKLPLPPLASDFLSQLEMSSTPGAVVCSGNELPTTPVVTVEKDAAIVGLIALDDNTCSINGTSYDLDGFLACNGVDVPPLILQGLPITPMKLRTNSVIASGAADFCKEPDSDAAMEALETTCIDHLLPQVHCPVGFTEQSRYNVNVVKSSASLVPERSATLSAAALPQIISDFDSSVNSDYMPMLHTGLGIQCSQNCTQASLGHSASNIALNATDNGWSPCVLNIQRSSNVQAIARRLRMDESESDDDLPPDVASFGIIGRDGGFGTCTDGEDEDAEITTVIARFDGAERCNLSLVQQPPSLRKEVPSKSSDLCTYASGIEDLDDKALNVLKLLHPDAF